MTLEQHPPFDAEAFLESAGIARRIVAYRRAEVIVCQGDACHHVFYLQHGGVKLTVMSKAGREALVAMLGPGSFFGEGCLTGLAAHPDSATATTESLVLLVDKEHMLRLLHTQHAMSDRFIAHLLSRNIRIEEDLIDQMFSSSEKRLARTLLLLAGCGKHDTVAPGQAARIIPPITQAALADMVGTTRSRVNVFMKKFAHLGLVDATDEGVKVNHRELTRFLDN